MNEIKKGTVIQSLQVGISILDLIARHGQPMSFTEIFEKTQITKSNLYKYLNTFTQLGMLYRDKKSGTYLLGSKMVEYGMAAVNQENLVERVTPFMHDINRECNETVLLSVWTSNGPMVIQIVNSHQRINIGAEMGTYLPLLSAAGRVFAAFMEPLRIEKWMQEHTATFSPERKKSLETELQAIREQRISFAREPLVSSVSSVALPILNFKRTMLGALIVVGFSQSIPDHVDHPLSQYLLRMGKEISEAFGFAEE